jgi:putative transposase
MVRLRHYDDLGTARFVTVACHRRLHLLNHDEDILFLLEEIDSARQKYKFSILAYVIMPNHFHLVLVPQKPIKLGVVIGEIKSRSARRILERQRRGNADGLRQLQVIRNGKPRLVFWLRRCYDFNCRTADDVREKIDYCHKNPVRAGLVHESSQWPWSSYGWYYGPNEGPISVDSISI